MEYPVYHASRQGGMTGMWNNPAVMSVARAELLVCGTFRSSCESNGRDDRYVEHPGCHVCGKGGMRGM